MKMNEYKGYTFIFGKKFQGEYKIAKKHHWKNIDEDFIRLQITLIDDLEDKKRFSKNTCVRIAGLDRRVSCPAFIVKNFRCKHLKLGSRSGFRVTFVYFSNEKKIEFIEFFEKSEKELPNKNRINDIFVK